MGSIRAVKSYKLKKKISKMCDKDVDKEIIIEGTQFDRKRKLSNADIKNISKMLKKGQSYHSIADAFGMDVRTIRYSLDPSYRLKRIEQSNGRHYGVDNITFENRVQYKRDLVNSGRYV